jgi:hypothetical protein
VVQSTPVSEFVFHPAHNHWHITDVALFEIRTALDNGTGGRYGAVFSNQSIKTTFCLIDWVKLEGNSHTTERNYWDCFPDAVQGISAGWGDYLVSIANPDGNFIETTTTNNTAWTSFKVTRDSKGNAKVAEVSHSPCTGASLCGEGLPNR